MNNHPISVFKFFFTYEILVHQNKISKNPKEKKSQNSKDFFENLKIRTPYSGVKNHPISLFKSFFIHKILVHQKKTEKIRKNLKKNKKNNKFKDFFEDLKSLFGSEQPPDFSV